jgi:hypothetical protein
VECLLALHGRISSGLYDVRGLLLRRRDVFAFCILLADVDACFGGEGRGSWYSLSIGFCFGLRWERRLVRRCVAIAAESFISMSDYHSSMFVVWFCS